MKKTIALLISVLFACLTRAQNLVPNPSFEDTLGCPHGVPDLDGKCQDWHSFRGTPDYFHTCSNNEGFYNSWGYQAAHIGQAYAGFATYQVTVRNSAEQLGAQLSSSLIVGIKYYLSFYVSPAFNYLYTNIATNKMGARLTTYQYSNPSGSGTMPNTCMVKTDSIVKDSLSWFKVFGSFTADSAYEYIIIGNFFDDAHIDTLNLPYQVVPQAAYYYVDDVCLSTDSIYCQTWTGLAQYINSKNLITIYPNPASNEAFIKSTDPIEFIQIINSLGQSVTAVVGNNEVKLIISVSDLKPALYYLRIKTKNGIYNSPLNIIH